TTPLVLIPARTRVSMPRSRNWRSRSVVDIAPTRVLRTTMSPGCGASESWMAVDGSSWWACWLIDKLLAKLLVLHDRVDGLAMLRMMPARPAATNMIALTPSRHVPIQGGRSDGPGPRAQPAHDRARRSAGSAEGHRCGGSGGPPGRGGQRGGRRSRRRAGAHRGG